MKNKIKSKKPLFLCAVILILLVVILIVILTNKGVINFDTKENITESLVSSYKITYDENGNLIEVDTLTGETKITPAGEIETLSPRRMQVYESESIEKAEIFESEKKVLDEKLKESEITEEEYYIELSDAEMRSLNITKHMNVIDDYILLVDKNIFNKLDQNVFLRKMGEAYNNYNAIVNLDNDSIDNEELTSVLLYVSGFSEKDFNSVRAVFVDAFGTDDFSFQKNIPSE